MMSSSSSSQLHGLLTKAPPQLLMLLLVLTTGMVHAQQDDEGGPPLGDNGFVGANLLPRPQGLIDLGSFGDEFPPSDVFQEVDQTFNQGNQLTHVTANVAPTQDPTPDTITSFTSPISSKTIPISPITHATHGSIRRQRAPFHPRLPLQPHVPFDGVSLSFSKSVVSEAPKNVITSSSRYAETTINHSLESATFQPSPPSNHFNNFHPSPPSNDFSKHISSGRHENRLDGSNGFQESSAFKVFHGPEQEVSSNEGSFPNDILEINFEENQHSFQPQGVQGGHHLRRPGPNKRRPSGGPLKRPIRQPFRGGRPRQQQPNNQRREKPNYLTILFG